MSTRRERKQTEKAEAATEEKAAAPPKEKVEKEKVERRQSGGAASASTSGVPAETKPVVEKEKKQAAAPKPVEKEHKEPKPPVEKAPPVVPAACHTPAPRAKRLKTESHDERVVPTLAMQVVAGTGTADCVDGRPAAACFRGPMGIAVDAQGNLFVADSDNRRVRMVCRASAGAARPPQDGAAAEAPAGAAAPGPAAGPSDGAAAKPSGNTGATDGSNGSNMVNVPALAVPQHAPCASSARAWRLRAARHSQGEARPLGAQPRPRRLERTASKAVHCPWSSLSLDHPGAPPRASSSTPCCPSPTSRCSPCTTATSSCRCAQPCSPAALQPCSPAALQPCSPAALQLLHRESSEQRADC